MPEQYWWTEVILNNLFIYLLFFCIDLFNKLGFETALYSSFNGLSVEEKIRHAFSQNRWSLASDYAFPFDQFNTKVCGQCYASEVNGRRKTQELLRLCRKAFHTWRRAEGWKESQSEVHLEKK